MWSPVLVVKWVLYPHSRTYVFHMGFFFAPFLEFYNRLKVSWSHQYKLLSTWLGNSHNKFTIHMRHATTRNSSLLLLTPIFCTSRSAHPFSTYATSATTQQGSLFGHTFNNLLCTLFSVAHCIEGHMSHVSPKPLSIPIDIPIKNNLATHAWRTRRIHRNVNRSYNMMLMHAKVHRCSRLRGRT